MMLKITSEIINSIKEKPFWLDAFIGTTSANLACTVSYMSQKRRIKEQKGVGLPVFSLVKIN